MIQIYDPFSLNNGQRTPFPGNIIPKNRFDPQAVKASAAYASGPGGQLLPNVNAAPGSLAYVQNNYQIVAGSVQQPQTKWSLKGDQYIRESDRVIVLLRMERQPRDSGSARRATPAGQLQRLQRS